WGEMSKETFTGHVPGCGREDRKKRQKSGNFYSSVSVEFRRMSPHLIRSMKQDHLTFRAGIWKRVLGGMFIGIGILTASAQTPPQIVSVTPANGSEQVPTNSTIVIVFDQDMNTAAIPFASISGAFVGNFEVLPP